MRYKLTIAYDGTHYCGWQVQQNGTAIQSLVQKALQTILRHPLDLTGSGRTDSGVHAHGQTAHFDTDISFDPGKLRLSLNALLPLDIRILSIDPTAPTFHARYSATAKIYHYHLHLDPISDPFTQLYRHQVFGPFDLAPLQQAIPHLLGTHDFLSFANTKELPQTDTIRTLFRLDPIPQPGGIRLEFQGDGFLYKMVRNLTGTLLDIAGGKVEPSAIPQILAARDRRQAGSAAPPQGLFLHQVIY
jgi:tRNA pseudouridine38-40 synthase